MGFKNPHEISNTEGDKTQVFLSGKRIDFPHMVYMCD